MHSVKETRLEEKLFTAVPLSERKILGHRKDVRF